MANNQPVNAGRAGNAEIAQQWIEYLQKKNSILNLVWSVMLVIILILCVASFFFYHQYQTSLEADQVRLAKITDITTERDDWRDKAMQLETQALQLGQEVELLQTVKHSLEQQKGESFDLLDEKNDLLSNMKLQLTEVERHNLELNKDLLLAKKELAEYKQSVQSQLLSMKSKQNGELSNLKQRLKDRKVAFDALAKRQKETRAEVDRLSELLASEKSAMSRLRKERDVLDQSLTRSKEQVASIQQEYDDLERKLEFAIAPITKASDAPVLRATAAGSEAPSKPEEKQDAKPKQGSNNAFDFNRIVID